MVVHERCSRYEAGIRPPKLRPRVVKGYEPVRFHKSSADLAIETMDVGGCMSVCLAGKSRERRPCNRPRSRGHESRITASIDTVE